MYQTKIYLAIYKKFHFWYTIPCENVIINLGGKNHQMQFICVATASYNLGFLMTKSPGLVFRMWNSFEFRNAVRTHCSVVRQSRSP